MSLTPTNFASLRTTYLARIHFVQISGRFGSIFIASPECRIRDQPWPGVSRPCAQISNWYKLSLSAIVNSSPPPPLAGVRWWLVGPLPLRVFTLIRDSISLPRPPIRDSVFTLIRLNFKSLTIELFISMDPTNEVADRDIPMSESAEHSASTLPPLPTTSSERKNRSTVWDHFKRTSDDENKAQCQHCLKVIKCGNGTSAMRSHLKICISNPSSDRGKRQKTGTSPSLEAQVGRFDAEYARKKLISMFVREELPFRFVESQGFKEYSAALQPGFNTLSRITLARDILMLYETKKVQLQKYFSKYGGRVCLTTDNWSSCQNMAYMCLTVHFIDVDWKLQKKILNFCQVTGHTGEIMAQNVEACLNSWKLNKILSLTVDNASSNDVGVMYLKRRLISWKSSVLNREYLHMQCCAHILNLIVKDGLKEIDDSIAKIRDAVKYVRSSNLRLTRFKACNAQENIPHKNLVCIDVETQWNSTYLMLVAALKHQKAFELLEMQDKKFVEELNKGRGVPSIQDWDYAKSVLPFLEMFYDATLRISGSSYITSNLYMKEVFALGRRIQQYRDDDDLSISLMASKMKAKYNKYWGNAKTINMLLLIAVVLDPCHKLDYIEWCLVDSFGAEVGGELKTKLSSCLHSLYNLYQGVEEGNQDDTLS
ncbi:zinc finger BED domain-containing protein RICESLEEPER 2-like [Arachis hypogaea]|uniref:zinc finger BED domain-containing protein RICESLEEPER 2-like n=1 Tax=Arachis hypogaea TaxID=3818 RepID=UPI000DED9F2A|nr:zinc finger BED domain-containing protein RICESLEEPER 2-like [Arachis hypogaea]